MKKLKKFCQNVSLNTSIALWSFAVVTIGLGVYSCVCPPEGVIDKSIIEFGALMSFFATIAVAREAIKEGRGLKLNKGDFTLETTHDDELQH